MGAGAGRERRRVIKEEGGVVLKVSLYSTLVHIFVFFYLFILCSSFLSPPFNLKYVNPQFIWNYLVKE